MKLIKEQSSKFVAFIAALFISFCAVAQEKTNVDIDVNKGDGGSNWYSQPWVWIVGVAVFILLLVALLRGNSNRSRD